ncbi:MAG: DUF2887 domain-containing protein [Methylococcaceae bacterium]|nr:MAG: DUF2887 domain-containing protein [Methylococcaceae bacterium]
MKTDAPPAFCSLLTLPEVRRVYLEDFPDQSSGALGLITLIVCPPEQTSAQIKRVTSHASPPVPFTEWLDFIETILVYKLPQLTREEIKQMIGIQDVELKQTRFYQDVFSEGRMEEAQTLLLRLLTKRFGAVNDEVRQRIGQATTEQLEIWTDNILDAKTLAAIFDRH